MANISSRSYRNIAGVKWYLTRNERKRAENREYVAIGATNGALVSTFFEQMEKSHEKWGRSGQRVALERDKKGTIVRDENGVPVERKDRGGRPVFEGEYVQYYSLVQGFGTDELDPGDPEAWEECQRRGLALAKELSQQAASSTLKNGVIVDKKNADAAASDGHMALVVTEIGGSGKLHNHIILDATNRFTGGQVNSAFMTHHRLAKTHDRLLAEIGVEQREDMRQLAAEVEARQKNGEKGFSYRTVARETRERPNGIEDRQDLRYEQWLKENELAKYDRLSELPVEPFAVGELKRRIQAVLGDERSVSWEQMQAAAAELHLTVTKRGKDISFGMMRQQADGRFAEPAKSDIRRGSTLGDEFTVDRVERAIEENDKARQQRDLLAAYEPEMRQLVDETRSGVKEALQRNGRDHSPEVVNAKADWHLAQMAEEGRLGPQLQRIRQANEIAVQQRAQQERAERAEQWQELQDAYEPEMRELKVKVRADVEHSSREDGRNDSPEMVDLMVDQWVHNLAASGELEDQLQRIRQANEIAARRREEQQKQSQPAPEVQKPEVPQPAERGLPYRSQMRDLPLPSGPSRERTALRMEQMASLDENYQGRFVAGQKPDAEFEARVKQIGIGRKILDTPKYRDRLHPAVVDQLELREVAKEVRNRDFERYKALEGADTTEMQIALARTKNTSKQIAEGKYELVARRRELSPREQMRAAVQRAEREQDREVDLPGL